MPPKTSEILLKEKQKGRKVQFMRMENVGENKALETLMNKANDNLGMKM